MRNAPPCSAYFGEKTDTTDPTYDGAPLPYVPCGYTPTQVRSAYGMGAVLGHGVDGTGVTVAVVDAFGSPTLRSDATTYAQRNDPSHPLAPGQLIETVAPPTPGLESPDACDAAEWYSEQTLDVEAAHAAAPGATIHYYGAADCQDSALDATLNAIVADGTANVVSNSYGNLGEDVVSDEVAAFGQIAIQAAQEGIGLYFSSGDFGDNARQLGSPAPNFPASNPWVTAVGGTSVQIGADGRRLAQGGWATGRSSRFGGTWSVPSFISGSGGGTSRLYPQPAYQAATVPAALATATRPDGTPGRVVPDIASIADPNTGLLVGQTQTFSDGAYYDQYRVGGTSLAAPVVAATVALADALDGVRHGFVNPALYATVQPAGGIDDVLPGRGGQARIDYVNGENASDGLLTSLRTFDDPGQSIHTAAGYDDVTGLGTLNAAVALALGTVAVTPANATSTAGATQTFTVAATDGFGATVPVAARNVTLSITPAGAATGAQCTADACSATQAGSYTITATYTGTLPTRNGSTLTASTTLTVGPGAAASVAAVGGTPQTATTGVTFAQPLQAAVVDAYGNPVPGTTVTFAIPAASAGSGGATFAGGAATTAAVTNSQGIATSPVVVAGQQTGPIDATATVGTLSADYTLAVTAAGPARADLGVTVRAPAQVKPGQSATLTVTVTNAGPSAATRIGTFVLVPRGWKVTNPGGATQRRGQLLAFTAPSLASRSSLTYTVVLTTAAQRQIAAVAAATLSGTQDPNYRNNAGAAVVTVR